MSGPCLIAGAAGELEVQVDASADSTADSPLALICHPHPQHGGSLHNKVVHILAKTFAQQGARVVRFNFRGVGASQGEFAQGLGEQDDLLAVHAWLLTQWPNAPIWLAGFSFGAYVAAACESRIQPQRLVLVAPAVDMYPAMQALQLMTPGWILVQGGQDEIVDPQAVEAWEATQQLRAVWLRLDEAGHFFHGKLNLLKDGLLDLW